MQDDSSINTPSKTKVQRSQSSITDSFRMAASVLQSGSGSSKRALHLTVPNIRLKDKDDYKKQPQCQVCFIQFGRFGQHHCRICANAVCSSCSFSTINKQRACDKCSYHYSDSQRQIFKQQTLRLLTSLCVDFLGVKLQAQEQLKALQAEVPNKEEERLREKKTADEKLKKQNQKLEQLAKERKRLEEEVERIKNA